MRRGASCRMKHTLCNKIIWLSGMDACAGDVAIHSLVQCLQANSALCVLDVSGCKLGHGGAATLFDKLTQNCTIQNLNMAKNPIGDRGAAGIARLMFNVPLTMLDMSYNQIRTGGAECLAQALQRCTVRLTAPINPEMMQYHITAFNADLLI